jgi:hypothetical protein
MASPSSVSSLQHDLDPVREVRRGTTLVVTESALAVSGLSGDDGVSAIRSWQRSQIHVDDEFTSSAGVADLLHVTADAAA